MALPLAFPYTPAKPVSSRRQVYINIVMEYCDGVDLTGIIKRRRGELMTEDDIMEKFAQVGGSCS